MKNINFGQEKFFGPHQERRHSKNFTEFQPELFPHMMSLLATPPMHYL